MQRREGAFLQAFILPSHFCPFVSNAFSWHLLLLKHKKIKKNTKKKKIVEKGRNFPLSSRSTLSLLAPVYAFLLFPFCFKHFLLASSSFQVEKKCTEEGRELTFKLSLCPLTFSSLFCPPVFAFLFQVFFPWHLLLLK